jgi:hypothetical protein
MASRCFLHESEVRAVDNAVADHVPPRVVSWLAGNGPQCSFHNLEIAGINFPITVHIADQRGLGVRIKENLVEVPRIACGEVVAEHAIPDGDISLLSKYNRGGLGREVAQSKGGGGGACRHHAQSAAATTDWTHRVYFTGRVMKGE